MSAWITHLDGSQEDFRDRSQLRALLAEMEHATDEHGDVSLSHETEWTISVHRGGSACWENVEAVEADPKHLRQLPTEQLLDLMETLAAGDIAAVDAHNWQPGYPS